MTETMGSLARPNLFDLPLRTCLDEGGSLAKLPARVSAGIRQADPLKREGATGIVFPLYSAGEVLALPVVARVGIWSMIGNVRSLR